jgi:dTDP-4-amino-4,6-dideoxy-D-galactose acyltransferase
MKPDARVCLLDWDTNFFGIRIARINDDHLDSDSMKSALTWCLDNQIECVYLLTNPAESATIKLIEGSGFHLVDIRVTLDRQIQATSLPWRPEASFIRMATIDDIPALRQIAAVNHHDTRFYQDKGFPRERCDELYATWIEKSCTDFADAVLVAELDEIPVGYLTCHLHDNKVGQIGLVGVSNNCQGRGIGQQLLDESLRWFASAGINRIEVVTQGNNITAQRLYQKKGFMTKSMQVWFHKWFSSMNAVS